MTLDSGAVNEQIVKVRDNSLPNEQEEHVIHYRLERAWGTS